jgi:hypothetical protein
MGNRQSFATKCQETIVAVVHALIRHGRPATVNFFVVPFVINALKRQFGRARAKVAVELGKIIGPRAIHRNAPTAIMLEVLAVGFETASFGVFPGAIFPGPASAMNRRARADRVAVKASTAFRRPAFETVGIGRLVLAAGTTAPPHRPSIVDLVKPEHGQPSKPLPSQIYRFSSHKA